MLLRQLNPSKSFLKTSINILKIILSYERQYFYKTVCTRWVNLFEQGWVCFCEHQGRYAADPINGVIKAAFAIGSDTDTIASMTGGLLGCINGTEWLSSLKGGIQDAAYIEKAALQLLSEKYEKFVKLKTIKQTVLKNWLDDAVKIFGGGTVTLLDGRKAIVECAPDQIGRSGKSGYNSENLYLTMDRAYI